MNEPEASAGEPRAGRNSRLSAEDWAQAALDLIAEQGVGAVAVEPLARRLLPQPEAWMQSSGLVQDKVDALPENTPKRDWDRQVIDVQDTHIKNAEPGEDAPA